MIILEKVAFGLKPGTYLNHVTVTDWRCGCQTHFRPAHCRW